MLSLTLVLDSALANTPICLLVGGEVLRSRYSRSTTLVKTV